MIDHQVAGREGLPAGEPGEELGGGGLGEPGGQHQEASPVAADDVVGEAGRQVTTGRRSGRASAVRRAGPRRCCCQRTFPLRLPWFLIIARVATTANGKGEYALPGPFRKDRRISAERPRRRGS